MILRTKKQHQIVLYTILYFFQFLSPMMITSKTDKNKYEYMVYENGMKVVLVSNPEFDKSACAVSVGVGSFDNPKDIDGLAHFLEHMLFMGSEKHPNENYFMELVNKYGGYTNAYTASEKTCYYSSIHKDHLEELVDALSGFFINPLLKADGISRELNAVHSEYTNGLDDQETLEWDALKEFVKDDVHLKKFECGNLETLKRPEIHKEVSEFYKEWYSSDKCVLVLCGVEPIEKLRDMASVFKNVKKNESVKHRTLSSDIALFKEEFLARELKAKSLNDKEDVKVHIIVPPMREMFKTNPMGFIDHLLCTEERGSLLNNLKNRGMGYGAHLTSEDFVEFTIVEFTLQLTDLKYKHEAQQMLYDELTCVLPGKITEKEYNRIKQIKKLELDYSENSGVIDIALEISEGTLSYPWNYTLHGDKVFEKFDRDVIMNALNLMSDYKKWLIIDCTRNLTEEEEKKTFKDKMLGQIDIFVGDEYINLKRSEPEEKQDQHDDVLLKDVYLITSTDFNSSQEFQGRKVVKENNLHFVFDNAFESPKGCISIWFKHSVNQNVNRMRIYTSLLLNSFGEEYYRHLENNHIEITKIGGNGFDRFDFKGFNSTLPDIVVKFFEFSRINTKFTPSEISKLKSSYTKKIYGSPYIRAFDVFNKHLKGLKQLEELLVELDEMNSDCFSENCLANLSFDVVAVGNLDYNEIKKMNLALKLQSIDKNILPNELNVVNGGEVTFTAHNTTNNLLYRFYQVPKGQYHYFLLFSQIFSEKFFDELRTKEQLGYVVDLEFRNACNEMFIALLVQSERSVPYLSRRFDAFIKEVPDKIDDIDEEEFSEFKEGAIINLTEKMQSMDELFDHSNFVYKYHGFDFGELPNLAEKIAKLAKDEFKSILDFEKLNKMEVKTNKE